MSEIKARSRIALQPKQTQLFNLVRNHPATWVGYGGSRGGAKSHAARAVMLMMLMEHAGSRGCILRRTYDLVRENHIEPLLDQYPFMREWYRVGDKELLLPNRSVLAFRYAETKGDVDSMIGKQYRWFAVDQAEAFTERELNTMKSCARWPGATSKLILTFNPGNIGHAFLKRIFYDKKYNANEHAEDYVFLQAFGWDNLEWARQPLHKDGFTDEQLDSQTSPYYAWSAEKRFQYFIERTQYGRELNALPQAMRIGWLLGRMDQFAGQYYDIFSPERHIARCQPEEWHTRWLGIDWGFAHESVAHWCSQIQERLTAFYREFAGTGRSPKALAQEIVDRTPIAERSHIKHIFLSHDAFSKRDERDTIADQMSVVFREAGMPYPEMATKDVVGRAALLYDLLGPMDPVTHELKKPEIVIDPSCKRLIDTIPMVCRDTDDPERPLKFEGDDAIDSAWYSLTYRMRRQPMPDERVAMLEMDKITDPVAKWFAITAYRRKHQSNPIIQPKVQMPWEAR